MRSPIHAIDLFCGAGGLTSGLQSAGVRVRAGIDIDESCKYPYEFNNGAEFIPLGVERISGESLSEFFPKSAYSLLAGCAPCQPFSKYTQGRDPKTDPKWNLLNHFSRLIDEAEPDFVTMENVATLSRHSVFRKFQDRLEEAGYHVDCQVMDCEEFGLPQTRKRLVLIASRHGKIYLPKAGKARKTVRSVIGKMPEIGAGEGHAKDPLHRAASLTPVNLRRIRASKPGGTWRDWPVSLRATCHTKKSGRSYPSVYGRMEWDAAAPTMTTLCYGFGNGRFGHPEQDRAISLREAAIIQSFPKDYAFTQKNERVNFKAIGRMIGNAVPPLIGQIVGKTFLEHVETLG